METLRTPDGESLAYSLRPPSNDHTATVVFLSGFRSHMQGTKAVAVDALCAERGMGCLRLDYRGHGASSGAFEDTVLSDWIDDVLTVLGAVVPQGPLILIGSSMGGWIMTRAAMTLGIRIAGLVGIAIAPDFTERLMVPALSDAQRGQLKTQGAIYVSSAYDESPYAITQKLIDDGRDQCVLHESIDIRCPVRLIHGQLDEDVPHELSLEYARRLVSSDVEIVLIKDGDHRLSDARHLKQLLAWIGFCLDRLSGQ